MKEKDFDPLYGGIISTYSLGMSEITLENLYVDIEA